MLRASRLPGSLMELLEEFRPCFTAPTFITFTMLAAGLIARPAGRTVCGMLAGAGLGGVWHHSRAHRFFAAAAWEIRPGDSIPSKALASRRTSVLQNSTLVSTSNPTSTHLIVVQGQLPTSPSSVTRCPLTLARRYLQCRNRPHHPLQSGLGGAGTKSRRES